MEVNKKVELEVPYIMNVLLYVESKSLLSVMLVSKKCKEACNGMKKNPWNGRVENSVEELKLMNKLFPQLNTLRIDDKINVFRASR